MQNGLNCTHARVLAGLLVASISLAASIASAQSNREERYYRPYQEIEPYVERPLVVPRRHVEIIAGFGYGQKDWIPGTNGVGFNLDAAVGIVRHLEVGAGLGLRLGRGAQDAGAERYARVNGEWLPGDTTDPDRAIGFDTFTNPYFRVRYAFLDHGPFMIGIEAFHNIPFAGGTCWSPGIGVPIHVELGGRVRIETGLFTHLYLGGSCNAVDSLLYVPIRVNIQIVERLWLGVRSGIEARDYRLDRENYSFPLGFQGGVTVIPRLDIMWDVVFPWFIHNDALLGGNVFFHAWGFGVAALVRI